MMQKNSGVQDLKTEKLTFGMFDLLAFTSKTNYITEIRVQFSKSIKYFIYNIKTFLWVLRY